jgi:hypothetical protein
LPEPLRLDQSSDRLDLFACGTEDKKTVVVFAVNPKAEPAVLSIALKGFASAGGIARVEAVCDTQNTGQADIMNHWEAPNRIRIVELPASVDTVTMPALSAAAIQCKLN